MYIARLNADLESNEALNSEYIVSVYGQNQNQGSSWISHLTRGWGGRHGNEIIIVCQIRTFQIPKKNKSDMSKKRKVSQLFLGR